MTFDEILAQVLELLQREKRVSYRALKRRFHLDEDYLEDLKVEIIQAKRLAIDEDGVVIETSLPEAERRQLTVVFCDLVDSTTLASQRDPEELREIVQAYQTVCTKVVQGYEGYIAQYLGDGLLIYFGYPQAHEDDVQRAVRTGLGMVEAIKRLNTRLQQEKGVQLAVRVGIHTGLVVVGEMGGESKREALALGDTPNIAARLQGIAAPDTVVLSEQTYWLTQGFFVCHNLGEHALKGLIQPILIYQVLQESTARSRLEAAITTGLTPLVGREQEVGLLCERWAQTKEEAGQVVLLNGEAGIGKSRLVQVLKEHVAQEPQAWLTPCQCSSYHQHSAFYPIIDLLQRVVLQFTPDESSASKLRKLEGWLVQYGVSLPEGVPLFASFLSIPLDERYAPLPLTPEQQKRKTVQTLLSILRELVTRQPVLLVVEDLHWADPSTLELLNLLVDQIPTSRMLLLLTCRPDFTPPWPMRAHLTHLTLHRLSRKQIEAMIERIAKGKALPPEVIQHIVSKTDGVPLFVEELTKMVLESGFLQEQEQRYDLSGPLPPLAIPATLYDSLMARLDRLATVKAVVQLGATLGREFSYTLIRAVSPVEETVLQQELTKLVQAELLYQRGFPPQATYLFKHALIQEAAYQSLLKSTRQQYHQRIAQVLERQFPELVETQPELLAHHYTEAGLNLQAIPYWQRAGQRAVERSANQEAITHLTKGIKILQALPDTPERSRQELDLQIILGPPLIALKGYGSPEVAETFTRAWALCQHVGDSAQRFLVLRGLWNWYLLRAELPTASARAEQLVALAHDNQDATLLMEAYRAMGSTLLFRGAFLPAQNSFEQGLALYDVQHHHMLAFRYGADPGVVCQVSIAYTLWPLGYPAYALRCINEAVHLAQAVSHPFSLAFALSIAAMIHHFRREPEQAQARAEAVMTLATEQEISQWLAARGRILHGWACVEQGRIEEGIAQIQEGVTAWQGTGANLMVPYWLSMLAEAYRKRGQIEEGLRLVAEALRLTDKQDERWWEAELSRIKGELILRRKGERDTEAETCFQQALDIARRQQAKSLELRAVMSLGRLWQHQGKRAAARELLAPIYGWFTEGLDTRDLQEAKALLEEWADSHE